ncbi:MAG: radical SAM family heme chaperone HemW [Actinomycetota bacterium]
MKTMAPVDARSGAWRSDPGFGVYVHIPFCLHRCNYCDFNTYEGLDALHGPYVDALVDHIETLPGDLPPATSVFFGGGTPTLLEAPQLARIVAAVRARIGVQEDAEVTIEANPETVDEDKFTALLEAGFTRVSIGVQSLVPRVLLGLGRTHSPGSALAAIAAARRAGVSDVSADLIYGSPWERPQDWRTSLEGIIAAEPDHISAYALTIEEGTPLATLIATGRQPDVDPDVQADRYEVAQQLLSVSGYERYEISNWSKPGRASRHNVLYWSAGNYLGVGAGAHGHLDGRRYWSVRLPRDFIAGVKDGSVEAGYEVVEGPERAAEALMLGLRLTSGIDESAFRIRFGDAHLDRIEREVASLVAADRLERSGGHLRLAPYATFLANDVITRLI